MKKKIIDYIESLEAKAIQNDEYFKQRNELYIENEELKSRIDKAIEYIEKYNAPYENIIHQKRNYLELADDEYDDLLNILRGEDK